MHRIRLNLQFNQEKSLRLAKKQERHIQNNHCYMNIFELVERNAVPKNYEVAFGYYGIPSVIMVRHCFFVHDDQIIDPMNALYQQNIYEYHVFKTYPNDDYMKEILLFFHHHPQANLDISFSSLLEEDEEVYCRYAIRNRIVIDETTYRDYMEKFDKEHQVIVDR